MRSPRGSFATLTVDRTTQQAYRSRVREKELRLALVCYGGISLAVYMHGVTREIWKLLRASKHYHDERVSGPAEGDTEPYYHALLEEIGKHIKLRVLVDIIAGASAGGINGIFLGHAISTGADLSALGDLWLDKADADELLDPKAVPKSRFTKFYAIPLLWFARLGKRDPLEEIVEATARKELRGKISRFIRSRWFEPPFSGPHFTELLLNAFDTMTKAPTGASLLPPGQPLDLFVTVTDYHGYPQPLRLNSPAEIIENEHRKVLSFRDAGERGTVRTLGDVPGLVFAARATASFPGAFPPFQPSELDHVLSKRGQNWPGRKAFMHTTFPRRIAVGIDPSNAALIDGSILNNAPFAPAIRALRQRPAHREIDRRFVYIDPKPGIRSIGTRKIDLTKPPGFFATIIRSLSDIPREQPIRDDLEHLQGLSSRVRRLGHVVDGVRIAVDEAIEDSMGWQQMRLKATPERLRTWRAKANADAVGRAGFTYPAYAHLKLSQIVESMASLFAEIGGHTETGRSDRVRKEVWRYVRHRGFDHVTRTTAPKQANQDDFVRFIKRFDLGFRIRRLRYLVRRVTEWGDSADTSDFQHVERLKAELYELLAPYVDRRTPSYYGPWVREPAKAANKDPEDVINAYGDALDLTAFDERADIRISDLIESGLPTELRRVLLKAYLGFPFFDMATFPMLQGEGLDEFDEIKVDRISPDDATAIRSGGTHATLKGIKFNSFGAFFSRAYRENDYLWGRLHGIDRLVDIVTSSLPEGVQLPEGFAENIKKQAFCAVLKSEAPRLKAVPELIAEIESEID